jgi:cytochrome c553
LLDCIFLVFWVADVGFNCITATEKFGIPVVKPRAIRKCYRETWMLHDTSLVASMIIALAMRVTEIGVECCGMYYWIRQVMFSVRMIRIAKFLIVYRNIMQSLSLSPTTAGLVNIVVALLFVFLVAHVLACFNIYLGAQEWICEDGADGCWTNHPEYFGFKENPTKMALYRASFYWCMMGMTVGAPDWKPSNGYEMTFGLTNAILAVALIAAVVGALTQIVQNVSRDAGKWETQLRHARLILSEPDVPSKLRHEVLEYLKAWHTRARSRAEIPADMLPPRLERQVFCALHQDLCKTFPLIQTLQRGHETGVTFFSEVSQKFSESMYVPMEQLVAQDASCERVHFIVQGEVHVYSSKITAARRGSKMAQATVTILPRIRALGWLGEQCLFGTNDVGATYWCSAHARTYLKVFLLTRADYDLVVKKNPEWSQTIEKVRLAAEKDELDSMLIRCGRCHKRHETSKCDAKHDPVDLSRLESSIEELTSENREEIRKLKHKETQAADAVAAHQFREKINALTQQLQDSNLHRSGSRRHGKRPLARSSSRKLLPTTAASSDTGSASDGDSVRADKARRKRQPPEDTETANSSPERYL